MEFKVKALGPNFSPPFRGSEQAAGYDICSAEDVWILVGEWYAVSTEMAVAIPEGHYGRVAPRSGLAYKNGIDVLAGVCDVDFRGEVKVILINHSKTHFKVKKGDRIAQFILEKISTPPVVVVIDLDETVRGEDGFGSTGIE